VRGRLVAIVMGVVILIGAVYSTMVIRREKDAHFARASALREQLGTMRKAIRDFRESEGRYPRSLQELVPKYLPRIPVDAVTNTADEWRVTTEESVQPSTDFTTSSTPASETYIIDVHSSADGKDATGAPFSEY